MQEVSTGAKGIIVFIKFFNRMDDVGISSFRSSIRLASEARRSDGLKRRQNLSRVMKASETEFSGIFFAKSPLKVSTFQKIVTNYQRLHLG